MKLVEHYPDATISKDIIETELYEMISNDDWIEVETKAAYELLRLRHKSSNNLRIVYQDNKKLRSRNEWMEKRVISQLIREYGFRQITHSVKMEFKRVETEIDAVSLDNTMIEMKFTKISEKTLEFLKQKGKQLGFEHIMVIGKEFPSSIPDGIETMKFFPDKMALRNYYRNEFHLSDHLQELLARRHIRYLLDNGTWTAQKRRYTKSAKWEAVEKMRDDIDKLFRYSQPIKTYWSLSEMLGPLDEFRGNGFPIHRYLSAFDIDGEHQGYHQYSIESPYLCQKCRQNAENKMRSLTNLLEKAGKDFEVYESGSKGYHIYMLDESGQVEITNQEGMEANSKVFSPFIDDFRSKYNHDFDQHRIFKVPYTVDASTGYVVAPQSKRIEFDDQLIPTD